MAKNKVLNITEIEDGVKKYFQIGAMISSLNFCPCTISPKRRLHVQNQNSIMVNHL